MRQEYARQQELSRHLQLEIEALRSPARIERVAVGQLHMIAPSADEETVLRRVPEAPAPDRPVVAMLGEVSSGPNLESN